LMILHLSRMRRNINRNVYNAGIMQALHRYRGGTLLDCTEGGGIRIDVTWRVALDWTSLDVARVCTELDVALDWMVLS